MEVIVNAAVSLDGKLSSRRREQIEISGPADFDRVDRLREQCDGILVGVGTVLADDPHLEAPGEAPTARVVADSTGRTPLDARILNDTAPTYLLVSTAIDADRRAALAERGVTLITAGTERVDLSAALDALSAEGIDRLLVEGGGELLFSLFEAELVDTVSVYIGPMLIGGRDAPTLADGEGFVESFPRATLESVERLDEGVLLRWTL